MIYTEAILIAIVAFVYSELLTRQGMIFNWLFTKIDKLPAPLSQPLIGCPYCVSGQMSLWLYLVLHWSGYNLIEHVAYISLTIFIEHVILNLNTKLENGTD